jgi:hypothetical protein
MPITSLYVPGGTFHPKRYRPGGIGNWSGHLPFANDLIRSVRPQLLVELGTHYGESYFGFCQAVSEHNVPCVCYAVDTWTGEAHAGYYGEEVYAEVESYNRANYDKFSYLLRTTFDGALSQFAPDSIDILHIDGLHTYEAVAHDFYGWLPKVKPGGIVLLHDIKTRHGSFGVWKLWYELKNQGATFEFEHSWGLGVFQKPGLSTRGEGLLGILFGDSDEMKTHLRRFYALCATELECRWKANNRLGGYQNTARLQVFLPSDNGYREDDSHSIEVTMGEWQRVDIDLISGLKGSLRLDLTDCPAVIEVAGLTIRALVNDDILWAASGSDFCSYSLGGTIAPLGLSENGNACRFFSFGTDPQLILPDLRLDKLDQPLRLQVWLRVRPEFSAVVALLGAGADGSMNAEEVESTPHTGVAALKPEPVTTGAERGAAPAKQTTDDGANIAGEVARVIQERESLAAEHEELLAEHSKARTQIFLFKTEAKQARKALESTRSELMQVRVSYDACRTERLELENAVQSLRSVLAEREVSIERMHAALAEKGAALAEKDAALAEKDAALAEKDAAIQRLEAAVHQLSSCRSMRVTAPMRAIGRLFKRW